MVSLWSLVFYCALLIKKFGRGDKGDGIYSGGRGVIEGLPIFSLVLVSGA